MFQTVATTESTEEQVQMAISRALCVTWSQGQQNDSSLIFLPETAAGLNQRKQDGDGPIDTQVLKYSSFAKA